MANKLRRIFNPTPEQEAEDNAKFKKLVKELAKDRGCSTCKHCIVDENVPKQPNFVTVEYNTCTQGLKCDTILFTVKHCEKWEREEYK